MRISRRALRCCFFGLLLAGLTGSGVVRGQGLHGIEGAPIPRASGVLNVIVRGSAADAKYAGFTVALRGTVDNLPFCTGSIVANEWILTAGHCVRGATNTYQVWTGQRFGGPGRSYSVAQVVVYPTSDRCRTREADRDRRSSGLSHSW